VTSERNGAALRDLSILFDGGATTGLTDGQLLERFTTSRSEAAERAFAAIVERHGPMVLRTCRSILRDDHDAQDASQATFFILARRAQALWVRDSLGPWLHRVARRAAVHARRAAERRRTAERQAAEREDRPASRANRDDLGGILHQEIDRLPDRYRVPIVLCDLEGRTYEEAARHLGCPVGTVKSRLARGRERLRSRLTRHGLAPSTHLAEAVPLTEWAANEGSRAALEPSTVTTLRCVTVGIEPAGAVPESVTTLARGVSRSMMLTKWKWAASAAITLGIVGVGAGRVVGWASQGPQRRDEPARREVEHPAPQPIRDAGPAASRQEGRPAEERSVPPFDEIRVAGTLKVVVTPGPEHRVTAIGEAHRLRALRTRVERTSGRNRLLIDSTRTAQGKEAVPAGAGAVDAEIRIVVPRLFGAIAEQGATVEIRDTKDESLTLTARDAARIEVSGTNGRLTAVIGDDSRLDASRLDAEEAYVTASGFSSGVFRARKSLSVMSSGDARVEYLGAPARVDQILSERSRLIRR
jgi:RNA polymerase sigma factor (sigma-70 family)